MAQIREFKGLRPDKKYAEKIAELPYDVCNSKEAKQIANGNPYNFYHITKPEIDMDDNINQYDETVYLKAKENLDNFIENKYLVKDKNPSLYLYTLVMNGSEQTGLVCTVSIDDYENNIVKKHEFTREKKENDRIKHLDTLNAQTGPVFLMFKEDGEKRKLWNKMLQIDAEYDFVSNDGIRHIFRVINDSGIIEDVKKTFKDDIIYIADGHHRAASAVKNGLKRRNSNTNNTGDEDYNYFLTVLFPDDQLSIMPYNRAVKDLNGLNEEEFFIKVGENFSIEESDVKTPECKSIFKLYINKKWYTVRPNFDIGNDAVKSLDVDVLQSYILDPILGIKDPRKSEKIDFIGGIRGTDELEKIVDSKEFILAFSMFPTSIGELIDVADKDKIMPPKSTWFEPKLRSGLILHQI